MIDDESSVAGIALVHPGEVLGRDLPKPLEISQNRLADAIGVPPRRTTEIVHGNSRMATRR